MLVGALVMAWPALYNRYPLLYPDSLSYLGDGKLVAQALFQREFSDYYGFRSLIYSVGILPLHWNSPWPVVVFNALLTSYILWLVVRSLFPERTSINFLALVALLSLLTGLGWLVGWIMPDIFGPLLYLSLYLLVLANESLSPVERGAVVLIAWWGVTAHSTHLLLGGSLCVVLMATLLVQGRPWRQSLQSTGPAVAVILAAALAQLGLNGYLYREISLNGNRPPYLLARVYADGPGKWYLQQHCGELRLPICAQLEELPDNVDDFLWGDHGWSEATTEQQVLLRQQELPVVIGTLRSYPRQELLICARHFWQQLRAYGVYSYDANQYLGENINNTLPGQGALYQRSLQSRGALPEEFFTSVQGWTVTVSLIVAVAWLLFARRRWTPRRSLMPCCGSPGLPMISLKSANWISTLSSPGRTALTASTCGCISPRQSPGIPSCAG